MLKIKYLITIIFFMISHIAYPMDNVRSYDYDLLLEGSQYGDILIYSCQGILTWEWVRVDSIGNKAHVEDLLLLKQYPDLHNLHGHPNHIKHDFRFAVKGSKIYKEDYVNTRTNNGSDIFHDIYAYNGEKADYLYLGTDNKGLIDPAGYVTPVNGFVFEKYDPRYNSINIYNKPISSLIHELKTNKDVTYIKDEKHKGIPCKVIKKVFADNDSTYTVWLAPSIFYRIIHMEITYPGGKTIIDNSFKQRENGIWFPEFIQKNRYYKEINTDKYIHYIQETLTVRDDMKCNIPIKDDYFEVKYPRGLYIFDMRSNEWKMVDYIVKDDEKVMTLIPKIKTQ